MDNTYVLLTGGKNNAGDFLIKKRAKMLFENLRKDRNIVDYDGWNKLTDEQLEVINSSKALILTGGPALQANIYPGIYPLVDDLVKIKVPILTMGIGWKSASGDWDDTYNYPLNESSKKLLNLIDTSGYQSSVRDYHTLNVLQNHGYGNFLMTGCPAYYSLPHIGTEVTISAPQKIGFSLGVSFINSPGMEKVMKQNILALKSYFATSEIVVAFHHSLKKDEISKSYSNMDHHLKKHLEFVEWLVQNEISYQDISGSAENLIDFYEQVDWHIGYRVHAHIFMNSISKFSVLLAEDGRGKATFNVIGGNVVQGYLNYKKKDEMTVIEKAKYVSKIDRDRFTANEDSTRDILNILNYQQLTDYEMSKKSRALIDSNYEIMKSYLNQLP